MADITTVVEAFGTARTNAAAIAANTQFTGAYEQAAGAVNVAGGVAVVRCGTAFSNGLLTGNIYTWNGTGFYFKPTPAPKGGAATEMSTFMSIVDGSSTDGSILCGWDINTSPATPTLLATLYTVDDDYTDPTSLGTINYNSTTHAWLGWYYDATNLHWVYSSNGTTWNTHRSEPKPAFLAQADLRFSFSTNRVAGSNTNANLDNVNINGTAPGGGGGGGSTNKGAGFMLLLDT